MFLMYKYNLFQKHLMKYTIAGITLLGLFMLMVTPMVSDGVNTQAIHSGSAYLVAFDASGNERFSQTIHNDLTDEGENYILTQIFEDDAGDVAFAENEQMGAICLTDEGSFAVSETRTASSFDGAETIVGVNCKFGVAAITASTGAFGALAVIGPLTFSTTTNMENGEVVTGIGICQADAGVGDFTTCVAGSAGTGVMLAAVNTSDVTVGAGESVAITYTLNLSSEGT